MLIWRRILNHHSSRIAQNFRPNLCRFHSGLINQVPSISPGLLARARALNSDHAQLTKKLSQNYDVQLAKQAGSLSAVVKALQEWEVANGV